MAHNLHDKNGLYIVGLDGHIGLHFPPLIATVFFWEITAVPDIRNQCRTFASWLVPTLAALEPAISA